MQRMEIKAESNQNEQIHSILKEVSAIGYKGFANYYKTAPSEDVELAVAIKNVLVKDEQKKVVNGAFSI